MEKQLEAYERELQNTLNKHLQKLPEETENVISQDDKKNHLLSFSKELEDT